MIQKKYKGGSELQDILKIEGLTFKDFLQYPDLSIAEGDVTFITGPSGCGKSTLLRLMNGILSPNAGTVYFRGQDIASLDPIELRRKVLLVGQTVYLFRGTVLENFRHFHEVHESNLPNSKQIMDYLHLCSIDFDLDTSCDHLSGGERHRIYLAIALSMESEVLLLDEPTAALDEETAYTVFKNLSEHCRERGKTLVIVSHDSNLTGQFAEHIISLEEVAV